MVTAKRLTDIGIERRRHPDKGRTEIWDTEAPGLGVRIGKRRKSFVLMVRFEGRQRRVTLGSFPALSIKAAREKARHLMTVAERGVDPATYVETERTEAAEARRNTVAAVVHEYIERYAKPNQRTWKDTRLRLNNDLVRKFGDRPIASLSRRDIVQLLDEVTERGAEISANRLLAHVRRLLGWCVEREIIEVSPAQGLRAPTKERSRDRVLSDAELAAVWQAAGAMGYPFGPAVQLLILTAQRRDEVAKMRWSELDLDAGVWSIPAERNKSGRPHAVALTDQAKTIIASIERVADLVFPSQTAISSGRSISGWTRAKRRLDTLSGVTDWRIHDLRRTAATGMAGLGIEPHIVERVLNHATSAQGPLSRVYQRYEYAAEQGDALRRWNDHVSAACTV